MSYTSLRRRHWQLSIVTSALALILTGFVAYGCYLFVQSPPAAGIGAAVVGVLVVALGYLTWGICGECLARRWYPSALFAGIVSVSISVCVMYVIHTTIEHSAQQQHASLQADQLGQSEALKQLEVDRAAYQSLLAPVAPVVSEERAELQKTIRDLQEQARIKRSKNYDRPADRIDESVLKLQEQQATLVELDAAATDRNARMRAEQAAALQDSIRAREESLANKQVVVVTSLSERVMLIAAVLIELITSGMMLYLARLKGVLDAEASEEIKPEVQQANNVPAPAKALLAVVTPAAEPLPTPILTNLPEQAVEAPVAHPAHADEVANPMDGAPILSSHSATLPAAPDAPSGQILEGDDLLEQLKPHERKRYDTFREHVAGMPPDQPIKTDAVAAALGFGKDLVSTFFKIAGQQAVIQKQGRQWFLYVGN